jgi:tetratricopeptide (TPR) repeat protein
MEGDNTPMNAVICAHAMPSNFQEPPMFRPTLRISLAMPLRATLLAALIACPPAAFAAGTASNTNAPDLTSVRAKVKAKDFKGAIAELVPLMETNQHADVYNYYAFSLRKTGDLANAATYYRKALDFDANHLGALEYQGEMFVELGQIDKANANLAKLVRLCPQGCEEREDLEKAIAGASKK